MKTRLAVALMGLLAHLPLPLLRGLGWLLGRLLFVLAAPRRKVALRNLALCFPEVPEAQRRAWARATFVVFCQTFLDRSWLWAGSEALVRRRVKLVGAVHELDGDTPTIVFAPHFYSMDAGGLALPLNTAREFTSIFATNPDPALDAWFMGGRQRFGNVRMLNRADGVKPIISCLRKGGLLYLLPDMNFGPQESIFVKFFGQPAATVPSLSRFARLGRAQVVSTMTFMDPHGYTLHVEGPWKDFPTANVEADTQRMNTHLEDWVRQRPAEYFWLHKRFKTRPPGMPPVY